MTDIVPGDNVTVRSRYWDHSELGEVVTVDGGLVRVQVGGRVLAFREDTGKACDPDWAPSIWIDLSQADQA